MLEVSIWFYRMHVQCLLPGHRAVQGRKEECGYLFMFLRSREIRIPFQYFSACRHVLMSVLWVRRTSFEHTLGIEVTDLGLQGFMDLEFG